MARDSEGGPGVLLTIIPTPPMTPTPRALRGRRVEGPTTAQADTLVKPEASGATSPPTVRLTLLQTLKLPAGLRLNFRPQQAFTRNFGVTQPP